MKADYTKKIQGLLQEVEQIAKDNLPTGVYHKVTNRLDKVKSTYRRQLASLERNPSSVMVLPSSEGKTATAKIREYLFNGGTLSSHQANKLGITSQGNQIITRLRRQGLPIRSEDAHTDTGHYYKKYYLDPNWLTEQDSQSSLFEEEMK